MAYFESPAPPKRRSRLTILVVALSIILIVLVSGVTYLLFGTKRFTLHPIVTLRVPTISDLAEIQQPLLVEATAEHPKGITRSELYADGALVAVQGSTFNDGSNPLLFGQPWTPLTPGRHILMVRAYTDEGVFADSNVVAMRVFNVLTRGSRFVVDRWPRPLNAPLPSLTEIARKTGVSIEDLIRVNPALSGFDTRAPLLSGTFVTVPRTLAATPSDPAPTSSALGSTMILPTEPLPGTPAAPLDVQATLDCSTAQIGWQDSADETGYVVYRLGPGDTHINPVATLPANSTAYTGAIGPLGEYRYQVAAVRDGLEGLSLMAVATTPTTCPSPPLSAGATDLVLSLVSLQTDAAYEGVYCYFSFDGSAYERLPYNDFSLFVADAGDPQRYNLQTQLPAAGQLILVGHSASEPVSIRGECLGRNGPTTESLGTIAASSTAAEWNNSELEASLGSTSMVASSNALPAQAPSQFRLRYRIGPNTPAARVAALDPDALLQPDVLINPPLSVTDPASPTMALVQVLPVDITTLDPTLLLPPYTTSPSLPAPVNLRLDQRLRDVCATLPADAPKAESWLCQSIGIPGLAWEWSGVGPFTESTINGYRVQASLVEPVGGAEQPLWERDITPGNQKSLALPGEGLPCGATIAYRVITVAGDLNSFRSNVVTQTTAPCPGVAMVKVTLVSITTTSASASGAIADEHDCGTCPDTELEIGGSLVVGPSGTHREWNARPLAPNMPFMLNTTPLRSGPGAPFLPGNNTIAVAMHANTTLPIALTLYEQDAFPEVLPGTVQREYCPERSIVAELPRRSVQEWAALNDQTIDLSYDCGQATYKVVLKLAGQAYP